MDLNHGYSLINSSDMPVKPTEPRKQGSFVRFFANGKGILPLAKEKNLLDGRHAMTEAEALRRD